MRSDGFHGCSEKQVQSYSILYNIELFITVNVLYIL